MEEEKKVAETKTVDEGKTSEPSHRTPEEIAKFNLMKKAEEAKALGIDPSEVLGIKPALKIDKNLSDDTPLTVGTLREIQKGDVKKTSLDMANSIEDEKERNEVVKILNRLEPSDNPQADFIVALNSVNTEKTRQVAEEINRNTIAKRTAAGGSASAKVEEQFTPTPEERVFMNPPYNMTKDKIIDARNKNVK